MVGIRLKMAAMVSPLLTPTFIHFTISFLSISLSSCQKPEKEISAAWIGTWGTAQQLVELYNMPPKPGLSNNTLRQIVRVSIGGDKLRVSFSNEFSTSPVIIKAANIASSAGGSAVDADTDVALSFNGKPTATIDPGSTVTSNPFSFPLRPRSDVAITIYFGETFKKALELEAAIPLESMAKRSFLSINDADLAKLAYEQSLAAVEYFFTRYGRYELTEILKELSKGRTFEKVFEEILMIDIKEFDKNMREYWKTEFF